MFNFSIFKPSHNGIIKRKKDLSHWLKLISLHIKIIHHLENAQLYITIAIFDRSWCFQIACVGDDLRLAKRTFLGRFCRLPPSRFSGLSRRQTTKIRWLYTNNRTYGMVAFVMNSGARNSSLINAFNWALMMMFTNILHNFKDIGDYEHKQWKFVVDVQLCHDDLPRIIIDVVYCLFDLLLLIFVEGD